MPVYSSPDSNIIAYYPVIDDVFQGNLNDLNNDLVSFVSDININLSFDANAIVSQVRQLLDLPTPTTLFNRALNSLLQSAGAHSRLINFQNLLDVAHGRILSLANQVLSDLGILQGNVSSLIDFFQAGGESREYGASRYDYDSFLQFALRGTTEFLRALPDFAGAGVPSQVSNTLEEAERIRRIIEDIQQQQLEIRRIANETQRYIREISQQINEIENGSLSYFDSDVIGEATAIIVNFSNGGIYQWSSDRVGNNIIDTMIRLGENSNGLAGFIHANVKYDYS